MLHGSQIGADLKRPSFVAKKIKGPPPPPGIWQYAARLAHTMYKGRKKDSEKGTRKDRMYTQGHQSVSQSVSQLARLFGPKLFIR